MEQPEKKKTARPKRSADLASLAERVASLEGNHAALAAMNARHVEDIGLLRPAVTQILAVLNGPGLKDRLDKLDKRMKRIEEICEPAPGEIGVAEALNRVISQIEALNAAVLELQNIERKRRGEPEKKPGDLSMLPTPPEVSRH
jgi:hypothetical protein